MTITLRRSSSLIAAVAAALCACGGVAQNAGTGSPSPPATIQTTVASTLTSADFGALSAAFPDEPFGGGQKAPLVARWVTDSSFVFLQFDSPTAAAAKAVAYVGVGVKGSFCSETRPDLRGSFTRFQRSQAADWTRGAGGKAGDQGYWLSFVAFDKLNVAGRSVPLGVDYRYLSTQPPRCGSVSSAPSFSPQGAGKPAPEAIAKLFSVFTDQQLQGGQVAPRVFKAVSAQALVFLQFDKNSATEARDLRYIVAAQQFESQGRTITPGVDWEFSPTPPPSSC